MRIEKDSTIMMLGSCFATQMGARLSEAGYNVCLNPFGTLFNPVSICNSIARMNSGVPFSEQECVPMGAGAGKICSFSHHTSFAREKAEDFLAVANASLEKAVEFWKNADTVILTLGTAYVWRFIQSGEIVSNCLKRPGYEFSHEMLPAEQYVTLLRRLVQRYPQKHFLFTVSPIRHLGGDHPKDSICEGEHLNQLSKATLLLCVNEVVKNEPNAGYFPAYEILLDELRDYKWFAADKVHPSAEAEEYIWEKFRKTIL